MAVEAVGNASMAWNSVTKVLNAEGSFNTRGKEAPERSNQGSKARNHE